MGNNKKKSIKKKTHISLNNRIKHCKKIIGSSKLIKVKFYEDTIKSNKTIDLINFILKDKKIELYFLMGADNIITFHNWHKWKQISQKCNIIVFDRHGYKRKSLNSRAFRNIDEEKIKFVQFKKVNISSSQLRKI